MKPSILGELLVYDSCLCRLHLIELFVKLWIFSFNRSRMVSNAEVATAQKDDQNGKVGCLW